MASLTPLAILSAFRVTAGIAATAAIQIRQEWLRRVLRFSLTRYN
jgi:hypothetical protein